MAERIHTSVPKESHAGGHNRPTYASPHNAGPSDTPRTVDHHAVGIGRSVRISSFKPAAKYGDPTRGHVARVQHAAPSAGSGAT